MAKKATGKKTSKQAATPKAKTIGINMSKKMADEIEKRAASMHLSTSKYCKMILNEWIQSGKKLNLSEG